MKTQIKTLKDLTSSENLPETGEWQVRAIHSDQCLSFIAWNEASQEALVVDPKREDESAYLTFQSQLTHYRWVAVIDTHTHADHVSLGALLAEKLKAPYVMHSLSPTHRAHLKVMQDAVIPTQAGPLRFLCTPGHTQDSMTVIWGPYVFAGDTVLFGDSGRDDLPTGDPQAHFESLQKLKSLLSLESILLPGHDYKGGRASSWSKQLQINSSLIQNQEEFVRDSLSFAAQAPEHLSESLRENFK
jgi:glyoxylase-like metal-dependent hydrolase (beta-lactamase superfamily II)